MSCIMSVELPGIRKVRSGKVREIFDVGEAFLIVATDRISAFDCVLPDPIPDKGTFLTQLSAFWFQKFHQVPSHFITADFSEFPENLQPYAELLRGRSMLVTRTEPLPQLFLTAPIGEVEQRVLVDAKEGALQYRGKCQVIFGQQKKPAQSDQILHALDRRRIRIGLCRDHEGRVRRQI